MLKKLPFKKSNKSPIEAWNSLKIVSKSDAEAV
jgi:hypothetical protein